MSSPLSSKVTVGASVTRYRSNGAARVPARVQTSATRWTRWARRGARDRVAAAASAAEEVRLATRAAVDADRPADRVVGAVFLPADPVVRGRFVTTRGACRPDDAYRRSI